MIFRISLLATTVAACLGSCGSGAGSAIRQSPVEATDADNQADDAGAQFLGASDSGADSADSGADLAVPSDPVVARDTGHQADDAGAGGKTVAPAYMAVGRSRWYVDTSAGVWHEGPPWVLHGGAYLLAFSTDYTTSCWTSADPMTGTDQASAVVVPDNQCQETTWGLARQFEPEQMPDRADWRRNYAGVVTEHVVDAVDGKQLLLSLVHGENKNVVAGSKYWQNTVNTDVLAANCASGTDAQGKYQDCWPSYNGFVNLAWLPWDDSHNWGMQERNDAGPIVWPGAGYTVGGQKSSHGVREPHGIVSQGYLYVFYQDTSDSHDRTPGIKVARARIAGASAPEVDQLSKSFRTYCDGQWVPALPAGFSNDRIRDFYGTLGPCATTIISTEAAPGDEVVSFAVAERADGIYMSVEEVIGWDSQLWQLRLRTSDDLIHWSAPQPIRTFRANSAADTWYRGDLHYPIFYSRGPANDQSISKLRNDLIDPREFYIGGSDSSTPPLLNLLHVVRSD